MTQYYVSTTGSNSNSGLTVNLPFLTIAKAISVVVAGDTINLAAGTYAPTSAMSAVSFLGHSGTNGSPITMTGPSDRSAIIDASNASTQGIFIGGSSYITLSNLTVTRAPNNGIYVQGVIASTNPTGIALSNIEMSFCGKNGFIADTNCTSVTLNACYVHDNVQENLNGSQALTALWDQGVAFKDCQNCSITNSFVYNNWGEGIDFIGRTPGYCSGNVARGNTVSNNWSVNIYSEGDTNPLIERNYIFSNGVTFLRPGGNICIAVADEAGTAGNNGVIVRNNITYGGATSFRYGGYSRSLGLQSANIYNNTFINPTVYGIRIDNSSTPSAANLVKNNIFYVTNGATAASSGQSWTGFVFDYQLWYGDTVNVVSGSHDVSGQNPNFWSVGSDKGFYRVSITSPAAKKGLTGLVTTDFVGTARYVVPTIGAFEPYCFL